ncbi:MAG TPA: alpha/beta family hydrolase [Myxococcales bacterium]|nr:alpha/beta family hydrolase [Myxococcales bacterium]
MSPARPLILFAPGAGAPSSSGWMRRWAKRLSGLGRVAPFDYPYMLARPRRKAPDRPDVLVAAHLESLERARKGHRGPVVLAGKSMGSRIGCHAAVALEAQAGGRPPDALVCFGYPLRSPSGALRDQVLVSLERTPILFVQGTQDALCPLELLASTRARMAAPGELHVVEGGDHSLVVGARRLKEAGLTQEGVEQAALEAVAAFLERALRR